MQEERKRHLNSFYNDLSRAEFGTIEDKNKSLHNFINDVKQNPEMVAETIGWLLRGHYGQGAYISAWTFINARYEKCFEWLVEVTARLEWSVPRSYLLSIWSSLSKEEKIRLRWFVSQEIELCKKLKGK